MATGLLTLVSFWCSGNLAYWFVVAGALTEIAAWVFRRKATTLHSYGEQSRRFALLMNAYEVTKEPAEGVDLRACLPDEVERRAATLEDPAYYASQKAPGRDRLVEILQESAFWSKHLYSKAATRSWIIVVFLFAGILVLTAVLVPWSQLTVSIALARVIVVFLLLLTTIDVAGQALDWQDAATISERVDLSLTRSEAPSESEILAIFADYSVATATASPIPTGLYKRHWNRLEREWHEHRKTDAQKESLSSTPTGSADNSTI